jgi:hypothetical protein
MTKSKIPIKTGKLFILVILLFISIQASAEIDTEKNMRGNDSNPTICAQFGKVCSSITFYEKTTNIYVHTIPIGDPRLSTNVNEGPPNFQYDFRGTPEEYYDVYISDAHRNLDYQNGKFVTIGCYFNAEVPGVGNNIVAVSLDFTDGTHKWATCVSDFILGTWLDEYELFNYGYVRRALGRNDSICTYMGCHQSSMTLGFMDASHIRLTSVDLKKGGVGDWISYAPADVESVDVGDYIRFNGLVTDSNDSGMAEIPVWSYNSFEFKPDSSKPGIAISMSDLLGNFVFPSPDQNPQGLLCDAENFWSFWFSANDSLSTPFLLTVGHGCATCNIDSMITYLQSDTSVVFDAIGIPSNPDHILNIPIIHYPPNDENIYAPENIDFLKSYCFKYIGPLTFSFLTNEDSTGWLNKAISYLNAACDTFSLNMGNYFRASTDSVTLLLFRDSTGTWRDATPFTSDELHFLGYDALSAKWRLFEGFWKFTAKRYLTGREREAALCIDFGVYSGGTSCISLLVGIYSDELAKPILEDIFCGFSRSNPVCRSQWRSKWGKTVDGVLSAMTSLPTIIGTVQGDIAAIFSYTNKLLRAGGTPAFNFLNSQGRYLRDQDNRIRSYKNNDIAGGGSWKLKTEVDDSMYFDMVFTNRGDLDLRIMSAWDDPQNAGILTLNLEPNKILFSVYDTLETVPQLFILNGDDTLVVDSVQRVNDSTFTAQVNISHLPNYVPGQKYSASIITNGYDLFSNFGQQQDPTVLGTITIEGDSLLTITGSGLLIPADAVQDTIFVTIIPGIIPESRSGIIKLNSFPGFDSCRFLSDLTQVTPNNYQLNKLAQLILDFDTVEYKNLIDSTIAVFNYDSLTSSWRLIGGKIDTARGLISIPINRFGLFGVKVVPKSYFVAGDANGDGVINVTDVVYLINYLFLIPPGPAPIPLEAGDVNCDGFVNVTDVVYLINYLFIDGPPPCR